MLCSRNRMPWATVQQGNFSCITRVLLIYDSDVDLYGYILTRSKLRITKARNKKQEKIKNRRIL